MCNYNIACCDCSVILIFQLTTMIREENNEFEAISN